MDTVHRSFIDSLAERMNAKGDLLRNKSVWQAQPPIIWSQTSLPPKTARDGSSLSTIIYAEFQIYSLTVTNVCSKNQTVLTDTFITKGLNVLIAEATGKFDRKEGLLGSGRPDKRSTVKLENGKKQRLQRESPIQLS